MQLARTQLARGDPRALPMGERDAEKRAAAPGLDTTTACRTGRPRACGLASLQAVPVICAIAHGRGGLRYGGYLTTLIFTVAYFLLEVITPTVQVPAFSA